MSDEAMIDTVAAALAAGTADGLTDLGRAALRRLTRSLYARGGVDTATAAALADAHAQPSNQPRLHDLRTALTHAMADSPVVAAEISLLWRHLQQRQALDPGRCSAERITEAVGRPPVPLSVHSRCSSGDAEMLRPDPGA